MSRFTIEQLNAAKDVHRHSGTTGGKGNARALSAPELRHHAESRNPIADIVAAWRFTMTDAIEQYRWDLYGQEWSDALCPF